MENLNIEINCLKLEKRRLVGKDLLRLEIIPFSAENDALAVARFSFIGFIDLLRKQDKICRGLFRRIIQSEISQNIDIYSSSELAFGIVCIKDEIPYVSFTLLNNNIKELEDELCSLKEQKSKIMNGDTNFDLSYFFYKNRKYIDGELANLWDANSNDVVELVRLMAGNNLEYNKVKKLVNSKQVFWFVEVQCEIDCGFKLSANLVGLAGIICTNIVNKQIDEIRCQLKEQSEHNNLILALPFVLI